MESKAINAIKAHMWACSQRAHFIYSLGKTNLYMSALLDELAILQRDLQRLSDALLAFQLGEFARAMAILEGKDENEHSEA